MTKTKLYDTFPGASWEFLKIAEDLAERAESYQEEGHDITEAINQALEDGLIYTKDQWEVLAYYCTPSDADFNYALENLANDLVALLEDTGE